MEQCRTLDADATIWCYYGDNSSCDNAIPTSAFIWNKFFRSHLLILENCTVKKVCYAH